MDLSDEDLLASGDSQAFAVFYRRYARDVLGYFMRRVHDAEIAADLTSETFAAVVVARERFRPQRGPAAAWLYGIAGHKLADYQRRGRLEDRARRHLGMRRMKVTADDVVQIEALEHETVAHILSVLPIEQREAIDGYVIADRSYEELAAGAGVSPSAMRHRVSRGLRALRERMNEDER